jgi:hypothetical protein
MLLVALAAATAATQLSAPVPKNLSDWFRHDDVPMYLMVQENGVWLVPVRMSVAADGSLETCDVEVTSGERRLDQLTCRLLMKRAKFKPARWADGTAAVGVYRTYAKWAVSTSPGVPPKVSYPDLDLTVQALPSGIRSPAFVRVMFQVDAHEHPSSCIAEPTPALDYVRNDPRLVQIACEQLLKVYKPVAAKDPTGKPIPSVQDALVRFSIVGDGGRE